MPKGLALLILLISFQLISTPGLFSQGKSNFPDHLISVYLDGAYFGFDYIRTNIPYVNYARHRQDADIHIMVTSERTGSGGRKYTLNLYGQKHFEGLTDTHNYVSQSTDSEDQRREGFVIILQLALARYLLKTPQKELFLLQYNKANHYSRCLLYIRELLLLSYQGLSKSNNLSKDRHNHHYQEQSYNIDCFHQSSRLFLGANLLPEHQQWSYSQFHHLWLNLTM